MVYVNKMDIILTSILSYIYIYILFFIGINHQKTFQINGTKKLETINMNIYHESMPELSTIATINTTIAGYLVGGIPGSIVVGGLGIGAVLIDSINVDHDIYTLMSILHMGL